MLWGWRPYWSSDRWHQCLFPCPLVQLCNHRRPLDWSGRTSFGEGCYFSYVTSFTCLSIASIWFTDVYWHCLKPCYLGGSLLYKYSLTLSVVVDVLVSKDTKNNPVLFLLCRIKSKMFFFWGHKDNSATLCSPTPGAGRAWASANLILDTSKHLSLVFPLNSITHSKFSFYVCDTWQKWVFVKNYVWEVYRCFLLVAGAISTVLCCFLEPELLNICSFALEMR